MSLMLMEIRTESELKRFRDSHFLQIGQGKFTRQNKSHPTGCISMTRTEIDSNVMETVTQKEPSTYFTQFKPHLQLLRDGNVLT